MANYIGVEGKRVLITGATSGLGLAMARALLESGAKVLVTGREPGKIEKVVATLKALPGDCEGAFVDVRDESSIETATADMVRNWGGIDVLINNAGLGMRAVHPGFLTETKPFWEIPTNSFRELIDTNLTGYFLVAKVVIPYFLKSGVGRIINIGINSETMRRKGFVPYGPSRAASEALSRIMAQDLAAYGVTVNILLPGGPTETGMLPEEFRGGKLPDSFRGNMSAKMLSSDIMAEPALFLCSDEAREVSDAYIVAKDFVAWKAHHLASRANF
jgi:NAD(P)-dependent dehydrogenase (short-subunit alcohol dehydrogenase family)